jgi:cysteinyl-tRNA synthetase
MKIYNSLTKKIEDFHPLDNNSVNLYSCGPTVYAQIHLGNLSSFIYADSLHRLLVASGFKVNHVMNITDVDDKTIKASQTEYNELEPKQALHKLTEHYESIFKQDLALVGIQHDHYEFTKATAYIEQMQQLIEQLLRDKFAYVADDGVYFSIKNYQASGRVYGQLSDIPKSSNSEARINNDEYDKASIHDFALWKKAKANEPSWPFKLNDQDLAGRPGWHIECSAMSTTKLGQPFDIHTGGIDLLFPHHENEIAQSTAGHHNPVLANYFFHNNYMLINNQKMSKSLDNFINLKDIIAQGFDPLAFRLLVLQSHYRSQAHFSWENLSAAENRLLDLRAMAVLRWQPRKVTHDSSTFALEDAGDDLIKLLQDDLNTPEALAFLSNVSTQLQTVHLEEDMLDHFNKLLQTIDDLLGLQLTKEPDITQLQKQLIFRREQARQAKDYQAADELRQQLLNQNIGLRDATHGPIWYRVK